MPGSKSPPALLVLMCCLIFVATSGCEMDSYLNPSTVGRFEQTPVVLPILDRVGVIGAENAPEEDFTQVRPADLEPEDKTYVIGSGDTLNVTIWELRQAGTPERAVREVNDRGEIRLPVVGSVQVAGLTAEQVEERIAERVAEMGLIRDAEVNALVANQLNNTYTIIGEPGLNQTRIGTYAIQKRGYTILEAIAQAGGVEGRTKRLLVFRQLPQEGEATGQTSDPDQDQPRTPSDPVDLIDQIFSGNGADKPAPPSDISEALDAGSEEPRWVNVDGKWVQADAQPPRDSESSATGEQAAPGPRIRVIEVPWERLFQGDLKYNLVIRPGDVIQVPPTRGGNVYIGGAISRPGTYGLPGEKDLTLKQLIFSAGNLSGNAIPERVDLIRRVGDDREATIRMNVRAIFEGNEPDIFLKPSDTINVGTSFMAAPLAAVRSGFRASYGFGFLYDRNFGSENN